MPIGIAGSVEINSAERSFRIVDFKRGSVIAMVKDKPKPTIKSPSFPYKLGHAASDDRQQPPGPMHKAAKRCASACQVACRCDAPCTDCTSRN